MEEHSHKLILSDHRDLVLSGVTEVDSSEDHKILLKTVLGNMEVSGEELRILNLDLTRGEAMIGGKIAALSYRETDKEKNRRRGGKLFR